jgi:hypothetical protein
LLCPSSDLFFFLKKIRICILWYPLSRKLFMKCIVLSVLVYNIRICSLWYPLSRKLFMKCYCLIRPGLAMKLLLSLTYLLSTNSSVFVCYPKYHKT